MATTATTSTAPPEQGGFPPFQSQNFPSQLFWLALTFVLLYVLMAKVALPRIGAILTERGKHIADDLEAAQRFKERSEAAQASYQEALAAARGRAQAIAGAERERQAAAATKMQKRLEAELRERLAAAEQSIGETRAKAMGNVGAIATDAACAILERLVGKTPPTQQVAATVADVIKR